MSIKVLFLAQLLAVAALTAGCASVTSKATQVASGVVTTATALTTEVASTTSSATLVMVSTATDAVDQAAATTGSVVNDSVTNIGEHTGLSTLVKAGSQMTPREAYSLGRICAAKILASHEPVRAESISAYIDTLGKYLALHSRSPQTYKGYQFILVDGEKPYAASTPGGFIFVSTGMVALAESEDDLAAVLAHEIGHIALRHAEAAIQTANRLDLYGGGALFKTAGFATDFATRTTRLDQVQVLHDLKVIKALKVFDAVTDFVLNEGFNQSQELEADLEAVKILRSAGYAPAALERMVAKSSDDISLGSLHPGSSERVETIRDFVAGRNVATIGLVDAAPTQKAAESVPVITQPNEKTQKRFLEAKAKLFRYDVVNDRY